MNTISMEQRDALRAVFENLDREERVRLAEEIRREQIEALNALRIVSVRNWGGRRERQPYPLVMCHENIRGIAPLHHPHESRHIVVALRRAQPELPAHAAPPREDIAVRRADVCVVVAAKGDASPWLPCGVGL